MAWLPRRNIVAPVDFSPESFEAIDVALDIAGDAQSVHVVHVLPAISTVDPGLVWLTVDDEHRSEQPGRGIDRGEEQRVIDDAGPQPMSRKQKPGTHRRRGRVSKRSNHHQDCEQPQHPHQRPEGPVVRGKHVKKLARSERHNPSPLQ